jgi:Concanavalin A-like lectin/glucanases superfamily
MKTRFWQVAALAALVVCLFGLTPTTAHAQPFGAWLTTNGLAQHGYIRIPHNTDLNPTSAITVEGWVSLGAPSSSGDCRSIVGKNFLQAWWIGRCGNTLRSYFRGGNSEDGGTIPNNQWTHFAAVFDGVRHRHYINGELVLDAEADGPPTTSNSEVRIGSDVSWERSPNGSIDEIRLWNVARTQAQIRAAINQRLALVPADGAVDTWPLDNVNALGPNDGSLQGAGAGFLTFPVAANCGANTATHLCLNDRFSVSARFRTGAPGTAEGTAQTVVCPNENSGLFWFFNANNWEIQAKVLNGCGLNNRYWVFSAATTNVFYRMEVLDVAGGVQKIYFNYQGPPAPAVTDTNAFATCP